MAGKTLFHGMLNTMKNTKRPICGYIRVSTNMQQETGASLAAQREAIERYAERGDYELLGIWEDVESGRNDERGGLQDALAAACKSKGILIVHNITRLGRRVLTSLEWVEKLKKRGADLASVLESVDTSTPIGMFQLELMISLAAMEVGQLRSRVKFTMGHLRKQNKRISRYIPYGYTLADDGQRQTVFTANGADTTWFTSDDTQAISATSAVGNPYGYTGRRFDGETENWYFRNRYYTSDNGRFLNRDPIGYVDGWNLYASYFTIANMDPLGLLNCWCYKDKCDRARAEYKDALRRLGSKTDPGSKLIIKNSRTAQKYLCQAYVECMQGRKKPCKGKKPAKGPSGRASSSGGSSSTAPCRINGCAKGDTLELRRHPIRGWGTGHGDARNNARMACSIRHLSDPECLDACKAAISSAIPFPNMNPKTGGWIIETSYNCCRPCGPESDSFGYCIKPESDEE